jgi:hypothetical protein
LIQTCGGFICWQNWTQKAKVILPAKIFYAAHNFFHAEILTNGFLRFNGGTLQMRIAVSRE